MAHKEATRLYVHGMGKNQRSSARHLVEGARYCTPREREQTTVIYDDRDVIIKIGLYGVTYFVRSKFSYIRYFVVCSISTGTTCTCGKPACHHILAAYRAQQESAVA